MKYLRTFESFDGDKAPSADMLASDPDFAKSCNNIKEFVESEIIPNLSSDELKKLREQVSQVSDKLGISKSASPAEITSTILKKVEDKTNSTDVESAILSLDAEKNEGVIGDFLTDLFSPKVKKLLTQVGVLIGIGSAAAGIMSMVASGQGWSNSEFLIQTHDYCESVFGQAAGSIGTLMFLGGIASAILLAGSAYKQGQDIRMQSAAIDRRRGASPEAL